MIDYKIYELKNNNTKKDFIDILKKITFKKIKENFFFEVKYGHTEDLRHINEKCAIFSYDSLFVDILFENNIIQDIFKILGKKIYLKHIQFRNAYKSEKSYAKWHRDTFVKNNEIIGPVPQSYKLMFYPKFGNREKCLSVKKKSNVPYNFYKNCLSERQLKKNFDSYDTNIININNSNEKFLFFDTTCYHQAEMPKENMFQPRIIYIFYLSDEQVFNDNDNNKLLEYYIQKCKEFRLIKE